MGFTNTDVLDCKSRKFIKSKNPANNSKAIEISLRIGSFLECSYSAQHAVSASGEIGDFFVTGLTFFPLLHF